MNIYEALRLLKVKRDHLSVLKEADKGPGLYSIENIKKDPLLYAKAFSEGDKNLEEFLLKCFEKEIYTRACCKGHFSLDKQNKKSYISFDNVNNNFDQIKSIINAIYYQKGLTIEFGAVLEEETGKSVSNISFRFNKKLNKFFYPLMSRAINDKNVSSMLASEVGRLYNICYSNNLEFIPNASITVDKDGYYILTFYNALLYLNKIYDNKYTNFYKNDEYQKRLIFNYFLSKIGFSRDYFTWSFKTDNKTEICSKLNDIYLKMITVNDCTSINIEKLIFFINDLSLYYGDYYDACIDTRLSCEGDFIVVTTYISDKSKTMVFPLYKNKMLHTEEIEQILCMELVKSIISNNDSSDIVMNVKDDGAIIKYRNNQLMIDTPNSVTLQNEKTLKMKRGI